MISPYQLGATMYIPATHPELLAVLNGEKHSSLRSVVVCLEDAIRHDEVNEALTALLDASSKMTQDTPLLRFIRPRDLEMANHLTTHESLTNFSGLVLPKFAEPDLQAWAGVLSKRTSWFAMPTLECDSVFSRSKMQSLIDRIESMPEFKKQILTFRIGGNDLMQRLALRRDRQRTLYDGPLGHVIGMLVTLFSPKGLALSAPVCEIIDDPALLAKEAEIDVGYGLVGKTAIHPQQIDLIHQCWMVDPDDHAEALAILDPASKAVFKSRGAMCEVATHSRWAKSILDRAEANGVKHKKYPPV